MSEATELLIWAMFTPAVFVLYGLAHAVIWARPCNCGLPGCGSKAKRGAEIEVTR